MSEVTLSEIERRLSVCEQAVKDLSDKITATDHNLVATTTTLNSMLPSAACQPRSSSRRFCQLSVSHT